ISFDSENNRIKALQKLLETINEQCIIWCNYTDEIETIHKLLPSSAIINGQTTMEERFKSIELFKNNQLKYLIISVAINEGFNLQNCRNAIFFSDNYSRTKCENAADRIHRIGQKEQCHIYKLIARGSLDERIKRVRNRKEKICNIFDGE
ncbi:MAG: SWF/SNF helicase family protein, partial [Firmicutes bacterium]|nr:SWF/SNF helicase family protein [Bacillota bacterium]